MDANSCIKNIFTYVLCSLKKYMACAKFIMVSFVIRAKICIITTHLMYL